MNTVLYYSGNTEVKKPVRTSSVTRERARAQTLLPAHKTQERRAAGARAEPGHRAGSGTGRGLEDWVGSGPQKQEKTSSGNTR